MATGDAAAYLGRLVAVPMTAAEQLAQALQRVIDEAIERALSGRQSGDVDVKMKEAGKMLGFSASYILRLCKRGDLGSTGTGHRRRIPLAAIAAFRKRFGNGARPLPARMER